ncbi:unnamed protein product [Cochlearia groenlandica]
MSTKSILLPILLLTIFMISTTSLASRQLSDNNIDSMFESKSSGLKGFPNISGGGFGHGDMMTHTCPNQGPCSGKKLTCPENCYKSTKVDKEGYKHTSRSGGCSMDCTSKCIATCTN